MKLALFTSVYMFDTREVHVHVYIHCMSIENT